MFYRQSFTRHCLSLSFLGEALSSVELERNINERVHGFRILSISLLRCWIHSVKCQYTVSPFQNCQLQIGGNTTRWKGLFVIEFEYCCAGKAPRPSSEKTVTVKYTNNKNIQFMSYICRIDTCKFSSCSFLASSKTN